MKWAAQYSKFIVAAVGVAATVVTQMNVQASWVPILIAVATALGVYGVPNARKAA